METPGRLITSDGSVPPSPGSELIPGDNRVAAGIPVTRRKSPDNEVLERGITKYESIDVDELPTVVSEIHGKSSCASRLKTPQPIRAAPNRPRSLSPSPQSKKKYDNENVLNDSLASPPDMQNHRSHNNNGMNMFHGGLATIDDVSPISVASPAYISRGGYYNQTYESGFSSNYDLTGAEIIDVPVVTKTIRRNRIIEVPEIHICEQIQPKIHVHEIIKNVPVPRVEWIDKQIEVPEIKIIEKIVKVPHVKQVVKEVPVVDIREIVREIPKYEYKTVEKYVEVPEIKIVEKVVEVPQIQEVIKFVERVDIIDVPIERIKHVPKIEVKIVEKIREVPGEVEYTDVPSYNIIEKRVVKEIEKIVEVPVIEYIEIPREIKVPCKGETIEIPVEVPVYVDNPEYRQVEGKTIEVPVEKIYEKIIECPVPVPQEEISVRKVPREVMVEVIKEIAVPQYVDEIVEIPEYTPYYLPPAVIRPVPEEEIIDDEPIIESAAPRYVYEKPVHCAPIFENEEDMERTPPGGYQRFPPQFCPPRGLTPIPGSFVPNGMNPLYTNSMRPPGFLTNSYSPMMMHHRPSLEKFSPGYPYPRR